MSCKTNYGPGSILTANVDQSQLSYPQVHHLLFRLFCYIPLVVSLYTKSHTDLIIGVRYRPPRKQQISQKLLLFIYPFLIHLYFWNCHGELNSLGVKQQWWKFSSHWGSKRSLRLGVLAHCVSPIISYVLLLIPFFKSHLYGCIFCLFEQFLSIRRYYGGTGPTQAGTLGSLLAMSNNRFVTVSTLFFFSFFTKVFILFLLTFARTFFIIYLFVLLSGTI